MGGLRDDLSLHERSLDVLIELLKKEKVCACVCVCVCVCVMFAMLFLFQLDESVPLHGVEKAISHFEVRKTVEFSNGVRMCKLAR